MRANVFELLIGGNDGYFLTKRTTTTNKKCAWQVNWAF